jgi:hypothetical protein
MFLFVCTHLLEHGAIVIHTLCTIRGGPRAQAERTWLLEYPLHPCSATAVSYAPIPSPALLQVHSQTSMLLNTRPTYSTRYIF